MRSKQRSSFAQPVACLFLLVAACNAQRSERSVKIDGSSTVFPLTHAVAQGFQKREPVKVDVEVATKVALGVSGTGGGFKRLCAGEVDIANASRAIKPHEAEQCQRQGIEFVEVPVAFDGLAVVVNPKNTWASSITTAELKRIWAQQSQGVITRWSQVRADWPDRELHLYGAGTDSGTYDYFTEAILDTAGVSRRDFTASEDDEVLVDGVAGDELALGFFGYAYVHRDTSRVKALAVDDEVDVNGAGAVLPAQQSVREGTYQPLSRPLFIYVSKPALGRREVELFVADYLARAAKLADTLGYVALPDEAYVLAQKRVNTRTVGSLFDAEHVGISINQLLAKSLQAPSTSAR